jgi:murein DD-endopeptidase MepM/ murein hydrolase activator NlpD
MRFEREKEMFQKLLLMVSVLIVPAPTVLGPPQVATGQRAQVMNQIEPPRDQPKQDVLRALGAAEQETVAKSAIPVLLLSNVRDFSERRVVVEDTYYSAFFNDGKQSISVQGSRLATRYSDLRLESNRAKKRIRSTEGFITESEDIWSASWKEFGAAYVLSLECGTANDERCESENYVTKLVNSLVYVGGGKAGAINNPPAFNNSSAGRNMAAATPPPTFSYSPPGQLLPGSGTGRRDMTVYAPGIRFPIESKPAYANSQVYNSGGSLGPPGSQCAASNYSFPWWDNFCETRGFDTVMCPNGKGHQGQDIRPSSCVKDQHFCVSATDGTVSKLGSFSVFITGPDSTQYRYLHMSNVTVKVGDKVNKGTRIGKVSNVFTDPTTIHLHFEIWQNIDTLGFVPAPPYMSLVKAYERLP